MQSTTDRGYYNLLGHLSRPATTLSLATLQASIAHYLAHVQPTPTPFVALVISSPLFQQSLSTSVVASSSSRSGPALYETLQSLNLSFRHAIHLKLNHLTSKPSTIFSRSFQSRVEEWVHAVLNGLQGGVPVFRLACACGILLGLEDREVDLKLKEKEAKVRRKVEEEIIVSLAEILELYPYLSSASHWKSEFGEKETEDSLLTTALLVASTCLPLVSPHRLKVLQLQALCGALTATIASAFRSGTFLSSLGSSISQTADDRLAIEATSAFAKNLDEMTGSPIMSSMAALSRTCALTVSILAESRPREGWQVMTEAMETFLALTKVIEGDWIHTPLAKVVEDDGIVSESRELTAKIWNTLKTLLFTNIMIAQAVLTALVYTSPPPSSCSPYELALSALQIFSQLSFVLPQFGGVTSTAQGGFSELKKVFYTALDILSADKEKSERFVRGLSDLEIRGKTAELPSQVYHAKKAYALACVEQLVPVLSDDCIRDQVYPLASPHLFDPSHRETYESAHSVMLSIFAAHARDGGESTLRLGNESFAEQITPFYARCLAENSGDNQLSAIQLSLAYAALVRSAGSFGRNTEDTTLAETQIRSGDAFAWYCLQTLIDLIRSISAQRPSSDYLHRLHLALIATLPSVSLVLLPRLLEAIHIQVLQNVSAERRSELVDAMFIEILENIGDQEKEYAMRWWYDHREAMGAEYISYPAREIVNDDAASPPSGQGSHSPPATSTPSPDLVSRL